MVCSWLRWALTLAREMSGAASAVAGAAVAAGADATLSTAAKAVTPAPSRVFHFMAVNSFGGVGENDQGRHFPVKCRPWRGSDGQRPGGEVAGVDGGRVLDLELPVAVSGLGRG